jgi:AcrR family transcriptional regulator
MARLGRPPATDSTETRRRVLDAARAEFATRGYAATTVTAVARAADLAPSAIYHYFGGKQQLYEAVFEATTDRIWGQIGVPEVLEANTLREAFALLVTDARAGTEQLGDQADFVALVPVEARLHPEFAHLLERTSSYQDDRFGALASLGLSTGELDGFTHHQATEILRAIVMGWFFERHLRGREIPGSSDALLALIDVLGNRAFCD